MDPNATVAQIREIHLAYARGKMTVTEWREAVNELYDALREWRKAGGFEPRGGWPSGV
jgi:hypothetical protein